MKPGRFRLALALAVAGTLGAGGCVRSPAAVRWANFGGDAHRGAVETERFGCGACHEIPGIEGAVGEVGPPLGSFGRRTMLAGVLPNTPEHLVAFLRRPESFVAGVAMPDVGLTDQQARDIAAYLYAKR